MGDARADGLVLAADLGQEKRAVGADGRAGGCGGSCAVAHERVGGRRLEGVDGAMRTGASVSRVVGDFEKRRIKGKARGGGRVTWWESKVE